LRTSCRSRHREIWVWVCGANSLRCVYHPHTTRCVQTVEAVTEKSGFLWFKRGLKYTEKRWGRVSWWVMGVRKIEEVCVWPYVGDFPALNTVYTHRMYVCMYNSGQPYESALQCSYKVSARWPSIAYSAWLVGLARTTYIWCIYGIFGRKVTKYTVIYGAYIRFWPTIVTCDVVLKMLTPLSRTQMWQAWHLIPWNDWTVFVRWINCTTVRGSALLCVHMRMCVCVSVFEPLYVLPRIKCTAWMV